jgi:hypothetical protein
MDIIKLLQPVNLLEEREKFYGSSHYEPVFKYRWDKEKIKGWLKRQPEYKPLAEAILSQDHKEIVKAAETVFQVRFDSQVSQEAERGLKNRPTEPMPRPTIETVVQAQQEMINWLGLGYQVVISETGGFHARPRHRAKKLVISREFNFGMFSLASSLRHDMAHIVRQVNGEANRLLRSPGFLPTEEGLASFWQDYGGSERNYSGFQHAAEYQVTAVMLEGSLRDGYDYLRNLGFDRDLAYLRAARHKYGFIETRKPGDIMKPAMYFAWIQKIRRLTDDQRLRLMVGKIRLEDLPQQPYYRGAVEENKLREYFRVKG